MVFLCRGFSPCFEHTAKPSDSFTAIHKFQKTRRSALRTAGFAVYLVLLFFHFHPAYRRLFHVCFSFRRRHAQPYARARLRHARRHPHRAGLSGGRVLFGHRGAKRRTECLSGLSGQHTQQRISRRIRRFYDHRRRCVLSGNRHRDAHRQRPLSADELLAEPEIRAGHAPAPPPARRIRCDR